MYRVGDRATVKSFREIAMTLDRYRVCEYILFPEAMEKFCGGSFTVLEVDTDTNVTTYILEIDGRKRYWHEKWLEKWLERPSLLDEELFTL